MGQTCHNKTRCLSLFSGGGGLDLGFDRAGFQHEGCYELIPICGQTLKSIRPSWNVYSGPIHGDVTGVDWSVYKGKVDVIHGGPRGQSLSIAGEQKSHQDERNMWLEFIRAVNTIEPACFVAENVPGILVPKFQPFVEREIIQKLKNIGSEFLR